MRRSRPSLPALVVIASLLAACDQHTVDPAPSVDPLAWQTIGEFGQVHDPTDVWGSSANDVYVGYYSYGEDVALVHFDGVSWHNISLPQNVSYVSSLWGSGADDVYAAAYDLWHYDGLSWSSLNMHANQVTGTSKNNVIVTDNHHVIHFNGAVWDTLLDTADLYPSYAGAAWVGDGPSIILVLGAASYGAQDSLVRFNNGAWSKPELPPGRIFAFAGTAPNDVIAVGPYGVGGMAWHWDGTQWTATMQPGEWTTLRDVEQLAPNDVYAASDGGVIHFDGNGWSAVGAGTKSASRLWLSSPSNIYTTGGDLSHFDGTSWQPVFPVKPVEPQAMWAGTRGHIVLGGDRGFYELKDGVWQKQKVESYTGDVRTIAGPDASNLYAATDYGIFHYDGTSWLLVPDSPDDVNDLSLLPSGELFACGWSTVYRYDGGGWTQIKKVRTVNGMDGIWAFATNNVLFGHAKGIERFNGTTWTRLSDEPCGEIWAPAPDNIYALGIRSVLHSSGDAFSPVGPTLPGGIDRIVGTSADHVLGLGDYGYVELIRGSWTSAKSARPSYVTGLSAGADGSFIRLDEYSSRSYRLSYTRE